MLARTPGLCPKRKPSGTCRHQTSQCTQLHRSVRPWAASTGTATADALLVAEPEASPSTSNRISRVKLSLLEQVAGLNRGALSTPSDKQAVDQLLRTLEASSSEPRPFDGSPAAIEGRWELLYANTEAFRASPFFLAFEGFVGNKDVANAIFAFTDAIPGAEIRNAYQTISLLGGSLISEVDMYVFPGFRGTVVTTSRASPLGLNSLLLTIESTRVVNSNFSPFIDNVFVPVEQILGQLARSSTVTEATYTITYMDESLRVTRAGDQVLLHRRVV